MDHSGYSTLAFSREDAILTVTLNRPEQANATNALMERELGRFFIEVAHDKLTRVIVLTGAGRAFSAGGDLEYIQDLIDHPEKIHDGIYDARRLIFAILDCPKPLISKVNGHAVGLAATLVAFSDVSFMADHARIGDPHVAIGFVAGDGGAVIWPQLVGYNKAKEYLFSGELLPAAEAERIGLVNHVVVAADLDQRVQDYATKVASMPARAVQWTKASINIGLKQLAHSIMDASMAYEALSNSTQDHREALAAIKEKRKPKFVGD